MAEYKQTEGNMVLQNANIALVVTRFNSFVVDHLLAGALDTLKRHGLTEQSMHVVKIPGAFEMPLTVKKLAASKKYDGIIALGAVIRGGTPHFEYVAGECVKGIAQVSLDYDVPIAFGVLTVDTIEQAIERAGTKAGNKGAEAALSTIEMIDLLRKLD